MWLNPAGRLLFSTIPVAVAGPLFLAVTRKVTVWLIAGVSSSTDCETWMSINGAPFNLTTAVLLAPLASTSPAALLLASLTIAWMRLTVAVIERVAEAPLASAPMVQRPVVLL